MSALPTYKVEIAFNAGPLTPAASRTWTDVTQWVLLGSIDIDYGRSDFRSNADANSLRLTLNNSDGRFTPTGGYGGGGFGSGPYGDYVKLGRPIRVTSTLGSASTRYVGFIDEWPIEWPATVGTFATATITATSRLAWLGNRAELKSIVEEEILVASPVAYYTLGEAAGATSAGDTSGSGAPSLTQTGTGTAVVFGNATGPGTDGLTAATFAAGKYLRAQDISTGTTWSLSWFMSTSTTTQGVLDFGGDAVDLDSGKVFVVSTGLTGAVSVDDGLTHHVALTSDGSTLRLYVDGALDDSAAATLSVAGLSLGFGRAVGAPLITQPAFTGVIAHAALIAATLNSTQVAAISDAGSDGFANETPAARLTRYASYAAIAAADTNFETGMVPDLAHIDTTSKTAIECMRTVEATEEGVLFDAQNGTLTFHARNHRYSAASAFTLNVPTGQVDVGISPRLDRLAMRNDVSAQSTDGTVTARATNQTSIDDYGPARESLDLATTNAEEPFQHASWLVGQYGEPIPRVPQLGVKLANLPTATAQTVLAATTGTRLTVTGMPSQAESSSQDYFIEGYSERIGPGYHDFTFNVSQAEPFDVWTVEDPVLGQYDAYPIAF